MLCELGEKIQGREDLKVAIHSRSYSISLRIGKGAASLLFGLVDDLSCVADLHQTGQTKRAACHVLNQTLDARLIARRQKDRLIDAKAAVLPGPHVLDDFRLDLLLGQVQFEDRFLPGDQQSLHVELGQLQKIALGCPRAAGDAFELSA